MHGRLFNELRLEIDVIPRTPLLIKSGDKSGADPTRPDMEFVRTSKRGNNFDVLDTLYIPGSSFRGVLRSHAERLARSVRDAAACITSDKNCLQNQNLKESDLTGEEAYKRSCFACKLFGNTGLASRVQVSDFYPKEVEPLTETRYGVSIDRVTGAVAQGPFNMEIVTDGIFAGQVTLRNFTLGQLGLLSAALLDVADGYVALGHAKSRGLGRVQILIRRAKFSMAVREGSSLLGIGRLAPEELAQRYDLPTVGEDLLLANDLPFAMSGPYLTLEINDDYASRELFDRVVPLWVSQVEAIN